MAPTWNHLVPRDATTDSSTKSSDGSTHLSTGAIAGIAGGAGALFLGSIILFIVYWRRQKRYNREDNYYYQNDEESTFGTVAPPIYTLDYKGVDTPATSSYTTSPQTTTTTQSSEFAPLTEMASAMPAHPAYIPRALVRGGATPSTMSPSSGSTVQFESLHARKQSKSEPDDAVVQAFLNIGLDTNDRKTPASHAQAEPTPEDSEVEAESRNGHGHGYRPQVPSSRSGGPGPVPVPVPALVLPTYSGSRRKQYSPPRLNLNTNPPQSKYINTDPAPPLVASNNKQQSQYHYHNYYEESSSAGTDNNNFRRNTSFRDRSLSSKGNSRSRSNRRGDGSVDRYYGSRQQHQQQQQTHYEEVEVGRDSDDDIW
ncbi:hypothetical protein B0H66DRAFT_161344 [Apodospora peruviana]|uniref:Uncharacterized protein n=1 Tax=Apodospora peruviana TaxID=516989 RepID=A0AAE0IJU6_9PEZI|nr:hypothetical protein B0H66DRAFT_161344 [Apodospora peruviana]